MNNYEALAWSDICEDKSSETCEALISFFKGLNIENYSVNIYDQEGQFENISYKKIIKQKLHTEEISNHVAVLAKNKSIRTIVNKFQKKIIKSNKKICVEGRDIASKILSKNPRYDLAFYFKCKNNVAAYRRWLDLNKKVSLKEVTKSLKKRTLMDKKRKNSPLIKVKDAILIRTDKLSKKEVLLKMSKHINKII